MVSTSDAYITTTLPTAPVTQQLRVPDDLDKKIPQPWKPRANQAVSAEHPDRPVAGDRANRTVLQQHVDFFALTTPGKIYPWDTYRGFHAIGFNPLLSFIAIFVIHGTFSYATQDSWLPDPLFSLLIKNIHSAKHGSDSGTYDKAGRFIPANFETIFASFDKGNKGALTLQEMFAFTQFTREVMDPVGWTAMKLEWGALWWISHDQKGLVSKEKIRGQYDGTFFYQLAEENKKKKAVKAAKKTNFVAWALGPGVAGWHSVD
ncbi:hypothetical protein WJX81_003602 [Elliptochloris bilobata]|uniref:Caleosin n=1 Tax=Elliptochloris bilobata TaxID=381761 RepID=A0AAW1RZP7_9CHLO